MNAAIFRFFFYLST
ncbi:pheST operon leader peptide PheM [Escherichia coli]|nr:pheST operon leader peptide PheM [Escherichia coli]MBZ5090407.1 pheST operon leader peptide PheM [Salmonella enterica subsp. enterica serovar Typhimurium]MDY8745233.1 pheST operon leader peptide PheM [Escherichia coli]HCK2275711.1 pheST operon leader peptide PheM [Escherichia coli]